MAVSVDFYAVLEIARDADDDTINAALKSKLRLWRKATNSPDLSTRQEAETWMARLREASDTLLDPQRRAAYDRELQTAGVAQPQTQQAAGEGTDWVARAREELGRGDYHSAAYSAREATHSIGNSAESWGLRSRANAGLGNLQDALYEARQATTIEANNPEYHFQLGMIFEKLAQFQDAINAYQVSMQLDPSAPQYMVAVANVMSDNGQLDDALDFIRQHLQRFQGAQIVFDYYATLLALKAESIPRYNGRGQYMITSKSEIEQMRPLIAEAMAHNRDPEMAKELDKISRFLDTSEEQVFSVPGDGWGQKALILASPILCIVIGAIIGLTVIGVLLAVAAGAGIYFTCWVPRYKANDRDDLRKGYLQGYIG
ncbi:MULTISPECIES: DnaJ domain-containing protein [Gordonia]|uniref:Chaperone protein DnaJ n=2 Tax=Gordonia TaxID=2053 RepID=L7LKN3_9ACTN|nr:MULTISPECIES: DnaJ domain-containing protein [Gordonia]AUH67547.1 molecular chaperone DnaJ [Gordonia sp. YC-JH1]MBY4568436.1 hypothetical protein [Gordonia sihwensis]WFN92777.1 DnaJ domain-containing protein [Gordonia sihwensis]GAC61311.1 chaperone protein DnaJ [Gordonia sihwensis NBRC 108236]